MEYGKLLEIRCQIWDRIEELEQIKEREGQLRPELIEEAYWLFEIPVEVMRSRSQAIPARSSTPPPLCLNRQSNQRRCLPPHNRRSNQIMLHKMLEPILRRLRNSVRVVERLREQRNHRPVQSAGNPFAPLAKFCPICGAARKNVVQYPTSPGHAAEHTGGPPNAF